MQLSSVPGQTGVSQTDRLGKIARQWGPAIRRSLKKLGRAKWSQSGWPHWLPGRSFRVRREMWPNHYVWWIERDIPPLDLYRCAAYQVVLTLGENGQPDLAVRTGRADYPVPDPGLASLERVLQQAGRDPALVIPRKMGVAYD